MVNLTPNPKENRNGRRPVGSGWKRMSWGVSQRAAMSKKPTSQIASLTMGMRSSTLLSMSALPYVYRLLQPLATVMPSMYSCSVLSVTVCHVRLGKVKFGRMRDRPLCAASTNWRFQFSNRGTSRSVRNPSRRESVRMKCLLPSRIPPVKVALCPM